MAKTTIEWTELTWNPVTGCTKLSPGCKNCYAERMSVRLRAMGQPHYRHGFEPAVHEDALQAPLNWKKPHMIFVNSMSDLFHSGVPTSFIERVFDVIRRAPSHRFQLLTKRSERLATLAPGLDWPDNLWMGVSVENSQYTFRVQHLQATSARIKFLSLEPLLGPLPCLPLAGVDWVIVGGESGPGARPAERELVAEIRDQCLEAGVPFFFKQWGGFNKKKNGRELDGRTWDEMPHESVARG